MKKYLFVLAAIIMALTACEGPMGPPGPVGPQGPPGNGGSGDNVRWKFFEYTVKEHDWELVGNQDALGSHYMYEFKENLLTKEMIEGSIVGYRILTLSNGSKVYTPLPYNLSRGERDGSRDILWNEQYSFDLQPGSIAFYAHYSDFKTSNRPPTCEFRIVIIY
ncbi:hypothetical protein BHU09_03905 [Tannerella sp. oral taxon 808]|nr:hypothetical protein BHU09_03905 [Tannerella sp. oral taxon 808]